jgi:Bacterial Ig-like domain (group 3)/FG-GAP-like repeat
MVNAGFQRKIRRTSGVLLLIGLLLVTAKNATAATFLSTRTSAPILGNSMVAQGTPITVSATVVDQNGNPVTSGTISFCDESKVNRNLLRRPCGAFPLASAQITKSGIAVSSIRLPIGPVKVVAVFAGTKSLKGSISPSTTATVTGEYPTTTSLTYSGLATNLDLIASVTAPSAFIPGYLSVRDLTSKLPVYSLAGPVSTTYSYKGVGKAVTVQNLNPLNVVTVDLNNDGYPDVVLLDNSVGRVNLYFNLGGTGLNKATHGPTVEGQPNIAAVGVGDFNADDIPDLILYTDNNQFSIFYGTGDGSFPAKPSVQFTINGNYGGPLSGNLYTADFNEDGTIDFAYDDGGQFVVFPNNGDGTFGQPIISQDGLTDGGAGETGILFYGDKGNHVDFAMPSGATPHVAILQGHGDGTFTPTLYGVFTPYDLSIAAIDLNLDGFEDIVIGSAPNLGGSADMATALVSDGEGSFSEGSLGFPEPAADLLALTSGLLVTDAWGNYTLLQPSATGNYATNNFVMPVPTHVPHPDSNVPLLTAGDFNASGSPGFVLARDPSSNDTFYALQAVSASAISTMTVQQSGYSFPTSQVLLGLYHPAGYGTSFKSTDSKEVTVPGTGK